MVNEKTGLIKGIIFGLIVAGLGIFLLIKPMLLVMLLFISVTVNGLSLIIGYLMEDKSERSLKDIVMGVLYIAFGLIMILGGDEARVAGVRLIELIIAIWLIFAGCFNTLTALKLKKLDVKLWELILGSGIIQAIVGVVVVAFPLMGVRVVTDVISVLCGVTLIIIGLTAITISILVKSCKKNIAVKI
ncbi:MAG: DUF308 domain-containing protein [Oscillospiraceae bacterium]|nr:DUF308 domain-containing protein [Oscillospiraceae bacterium]